MALDRTKFARVCGMLGSSHEGERASAALLATRMLTAAGMTWASLLQEDKPRVQPHPQPQPHTKPRAQPPADRSTHQGALSACDLINRCIDCDWAVLGEWEQSFLYSMIDLVDDHEDDTWLSAKQWECLKRIAGKLRVY